ncbi:hypothetical protein AB0J35_31985 [Nonomuraea angiospora]|uniref:hypothetical protein n=1 Tax=Nonomuraea angiospora TaxID=46172 RepID=UPI003415A264
MIAEQFSGRFATGVLADLDLRAGRLSWVNRGQHPPFVIRGGFSPVRVRLRLVLCAAQATTARRCTATADGSAPHRVAWRDSF